MIYLQIQQINKEKTNNPQGGKWAKDLNMYRIVKNTCMVNKHF